MLKHLCYPSLDTPALKKAVWTEGQVNGVFHLFLHGTLVWRCCDGSRAPRWGLLGLLTVSPKMPFLYYI